MNPKDRQTTIELICRIARQQAAMQTKDPLGDQLVNACRLGNLPLVKALVANGANLNASRVIGIPLGEAIATKASLGLIAFLLEAGADPSQRDRNGYSPLYIAADIDYLAATTLLLEWGTDKNMRHPENGWTPLMAAATSGSVFSLIELLNYGAGIDLRSRDGCSAFDLAKGNHQLTCARILLARGAN